jgi:hypothetical protein
MTPEQLIRRAETQTCVGCHFISEPGDGGQRYLISTAVRDTFVPHRMQILRDFLNSGKRR